MVSIFTNAVYLFFRTSHDCSSITSSLHFFPFPFFFFFNDPATTEIYTLSLHDALPISMSWIRTSSPDTTSTDTTCQSSSRSEEHTSELQSPDHLVCRLLLEKKKDTIPTEPSDGHERDSRR